MKFGALSSRIINFIINDILPPVLRDSRFMWPLFRLAFGKSSARLFWNFRSDVGNYSEGDIAEVYRETTENDLKRSSDASPKLRARVLAECAGALSVADIGCGRGALLREIADAGHSVFGCDLGRSCPEGSEGRYAITRVENLPYKDNAVDVVICSHVLEHIPDIFQAIKELRRVAKKKVVVLLPIERPYRRGFNLHLWFFPYRLNVLQIFRCKRHFLDYTLERYGAEWFYVEKVSDEGH